MISSRKTIVHHRLVGLHFLLWLCIPILEWQYFTKSFAHQLCASQCFGLSSSFSFCSILYPSLLGNYHASFDHCEPRRSVFGPTIKVACGYSGCYHVPLVDIFKSHTWATCSPLHRCLNIGDPWGCDQGSFFLHVLDISAVFHLVLRTCFGNWHASGPHYLAFCLAI